MRSQKRQSMCKIVISGYYGFNNLGDEAILETMVQSFKQIDDSSDIFVLSGDPDQTEKNAGVKAVHRSKFFDVISCIYKSDIFISGGGSLLQDSTSKWSIRYYLALIWLALLCRKKVFLYAHGIGPVSGRINRFLMKIILKNIDIITVRDNRSKYDLIGMGIEENKVHLSADPVIGMKKVGKAIGYDIIKKSFKNSNKEYSDGKPLIGVSMRTKDFSNNENRQILKNLIESLMLEYQVILLPFHLGEDRELCLWANEMNIPAITSMISATQMMSVVENLDILLGERLHSLIFAAVAGIRFLGVSYDPKIHAFMKIFDRTPICDIKDFEYANILSEIHSTLEKDAIFLENQNNKVERLKVEFQINTDILGTLLKNCRKD